MAGRRLPEKNWRFGLWLLVLLLLGGYRGAEAQYFGRNKVQYGSFDFRVLETEHFDIYFYPEEQEVVQDAARMAERWYERLSKVFNHEFKERKPIIFYANPADFQQTNVVGGLINEATGGVTEGLRDRVTIPFTGAYSENDHVIGHELTHAFQYDIAQAGPGSGGGELNNAPLWMIEGMAEYLSIGRADPFTSMWLRDAVEQNDIPTLGQLASDSRYFPYRFGQAVWAYVGGTRGDQVVGRMFSAPRIDTLLRRQDTTGFHKRSDTLTARDTLLSLRADSVSNAWARALKETYTPQLSGRTPPGKAGKKILAEDIDAGTLNLSPALSPDGRYVAFLSERDVFSIDLFMADATTGKVIKAFTSSGTDAHYDALSFGSSAGTWSPDAKKFAFVTFDEGKNKLAILDVASNSVEKQLGFGGVGGIASPSWSPDGRSIVFSGNSGGMSDLYLVDLASGSARRLTNDRYADQQPSWSPDGRSIAFMTDRGEGTDFAALTYSPMKIGLYTLETGEIGLLTPFPGSKQINPQYSPDGKSIYFVSDRGGYNDLYRIELATRDVYQVTKLTTGVSGLTALSPAFSVAQRQGRVLFTVFEHRRQNDYSLEPDEARGEKVTGPVPMADGILPPVEAQATSQVSHYMRDPVTGLRPASGFTQTGYRSAFGLAGVGQAGLGVATDRFGTALGGGVAFFFTDILGNNNLGVSVQSNGTWKDIAGEIAYQNAGHRLNWEAGISHIPYLTGATSTGTTTGVIGGQPATVQVIEQFRERIFDDNAALVAQYPFSMTRRFEVSAGFRRVSYDLEVERLTAYQGFILDDQTISLDAPPGLNLVQASAAYVGDYSYFGFTSPATGGRYRFELGGTVGSLNYYDVLADYRHYLRLKPLTFAVRGFHYGRYGKDAESGQLAPIFVGYATFVRGYDESSFNPADCLGDSAGVCPEFNRLIGSRIAVANFEIRLPVFGTDRFGLVNFPYLPLELAAFVDAGLAWSSTDVVKLRFERQTADRVPVFSLGGSARVNVLGSLVAELYYAYPFQRPGQGWQLGFQISPGW